MYTKGNGLKKQKQMYFENPRFHSDISARSSSSVFYFIKPVT